MGEAVTAPDKSWQDYASCLGLDPDLFFPERGASTREAKEACRGCVVREDCLEYALDNGEKFGIWGGMSERERRYIRRTRALARAASANPQAEAAVTAIPSRRRQVPEASPPTSSGEVSPDIPEGGARGTEAQLGEFAVEHTQDPPPAPEV